MKASGNSRAWLVWPVVMALSFTGVFVVVDRALSLHYWLSLGQSPAVGTFEAGYVAHPWLTAVHIGAGLLFVLIGPLQFVPAIRRRWLWLHRWSGRVFVFGGPLVAISAVALALRIGFGGPLEVAATWLFAAWFLWALAMAYRHIRARRIAEHREWMIRAFATGLAIATIRPVVGLFILLGGYEVREVLGAAFWVAFVLHALVAEAWIRHTRVRVRIGPIRPVASS